jgi:serine/threonine protein kinase
MAFFFQKKDEHPLEAYTNGAFSCTKCYKWFNLQGLTPLEMCRCPNCNEPNFIPLRINGFWLFYPLGGGGMGAVYKAYHESNPNEFFAVKILPRDKKNEQDLIVNLQSEAEIITALSDHPCIVNGVDSGYSDGEHYLATQYIQGERLDKLIERQHKLSELDVLYIAIRLLSAMTHIFNRGYLFRDLKPENVIVTESNGAYLYDYGICKKIEEMRHDLGEFVEGSPFYMPPERLAGGGEGPFSEIYSLGMVLYHAVCGKTYFSAKELKELTSKLTRSVRVSIEGRMKGVSSELATIIDNMIKRESERRYQNYIEVERDIVGLYIKRTQLELGS